MAPQTRKNEEMGYAAVYNEKKKGLRLIFFKLKINELQGEFDFFKKKLKLVLVNIKS